MQPDVQTDQLLAFVVHTEPPPLEVRVNFGVFAGREATPAELDELARALLPEVAEVAVVSELRHELAGATEVELHQVRIEVPDESLPENPEQLEELTRRVLAETQRWARACIAERHAEVSDL
jgi:hypothetical protein